MRVERLKANVEPLFTEEKRENGAGGHRGRGLVAGGGFRGGRIAIVRRCLPPEPCPHQEQNLRSKTRPPSQIALRLRLQGNCKKNISKIRGSERFLRRECGSERILWLNEVFAAGGASSSGAVFPPSRAPTRNRTCVRKRAQMAHTEFIKSFCKKWSPAQTRQLIL